VNSNDNSKQTFRQEGWITISRDVRHQTDRPREVEKFKELLVLIFSVTWEDKCICFLQSGQKKMKRLRAVEKNNNWHCRKCEKKPIRNKHKDC
jgi:hypothetical protein